MWDAREKHIHLLIYHVGGPVVATICGDREHMCVACKVSNGYIYRLAHFS